MFSLISDFVASVFATDLTTFCTVGILIALIVIAIKK